MEDSYNKTKREGRRSVRRKAFCLSLSLSFPSPAAVFSPSRFFTRSTDPPSNQSRLPPQRVLPFRQMRTAEDTRWDRQRGSTSITIESPAPLHPFPHVAEMDANQKGTNTSRPPPHLVAGDAITSGQHMPHRVRRLQSPPRPFQHNVISPPPPVSPLGCHQDRD